MQKTKYKNPVQEIFNNLVMTFDGQTLHESTLALATAFKALIVTGVFTTKEITDHLDLIKETLITLEKVTATTEYIDVIYNLPQLKKEMGEKERKKLEKRNNLSTN